MLLPRGVAHRRALLALQTPIIFIATSQCSPDSISAIRC